ncbi:hypothetical protein BFJ63_vAg17195 [Fusarium oxysporum f. sp. narcissi]|uniref:BAH domain-containing protein n=1 Tax=Fusarium oxysporum f. sp. narcissi TaxID=451672 RepID=A0A4Q2UZG5_FUSOX|nr:hypothetical protein BFJ63_vAg17195 [Fusarium oxysporum f. sp. narcissi]
MGNRKRSRSVAKDGHSNCPFTIRYETSSSAAQQNLRRYKEQKSPFSPTGSFKTGDAMGLYYAVEPRKRWQGMTCCESFNHNGVKYFREDFVFVANERTIEQQKAQGDRKHIQKSNEYWVAFILEIRASDDDHVYARVYWMYWPEDLPRGTHDGNKKVQSRQPYHGANEVIASNHSMFPNVCCLDAERD